MALWRSTRTGRVRIPLRPFMASKGDAQAPCRIEYDHTASSTSAAPVITPRVASLWPAMPLVAECSTTSTPWSWGRWTIGVAKVESTAVNGPDRAQLVEIGERQLRVGRVSGRTRTVRRAAPPRPVPRAPSRRRRSRRSRSEGTRPAGAARSPSRCAAGRRCDHPSSTARHERGNGPHPRGEAGRPRQPLARPPPARRQ